MTISVERDYVVEKLARMVRINSTNPTLTPDAPGEAEIAVYVADTLRDIGLDVTTHQIEPWRVNVVGKLAGTGGGRTLMLNAHMDTVGVEGMDDPFSAEIRDGRLFGRGSQDMKGSLAAMMGALKALVDAGVELRGDVLLTAVADEEAGSIGTEDLVKHYKADGAIVTEPSDMKISRAHRGFIWYEVETVGRAAHGSRYDVGIDAIMRMGRILAKLDEMEKEVRTRTTHPLMGPPSMHASRIQGGTELSVYAAKCALSIERRTVAGETQDAITAEMQAILDELAAQDPTFKATLKPVFWRNPFEIEADAAIVRALEEAVTKRLGKAPEHVGQPFWTDAAILAEAGIETVLIGPIGEGLHSAEEWVDLDSVIDLAHILADTAVAYCS